MITRWFLAIVVFSTVSAAGGFSFGQNYGAARVKVETSAEAMDKLKAILTSHTDMVKQANKASLRISEMLKRKYRFDEKTTRELRDALSENADMRADLRYSARVVRILQDSRQRAIQAAAGGFDGPMHSEPSGAYE